jgi:hypothetical protein
VKKTQFPWEILRNLQNLQNLQNPQKPYVQNVPFWTYGFPIISESHIFLVSYCCIDFFNFHHRQVWNFLILSQCKRDQNFTVIFQNHRKQKQKLTKYDESEQNQSIILPNFVRCHEILLNFVPFHTIHDWNLSIWMTIADTYFLATAF